jgi:hypothetical protein
MDFVTLIHSVSRNFIMRAYWTFFFVSTLFYRLSKSISRLCSSCHECSSLMRQVININSPLFFLLNNQREDLVYGWDWINKKDLASNVGI